MGLRRPVPATGPRVGLVDWGIGGLGLLARLDQVAPSLPVTYWSDTGSTPYGLERSADLVGRLRRVVGALADLGCTEVVLACNAASTVVDQLGPTPVPVEGIIGHGLAAVPTTLEGQIGVVGGRRTIASGVYRRGLAGPGRTVTSRVAQPLSAHIEAGRIGTAAFRSDVHRIVAPLTQAAAVVLACTHYPAAAGAFADELPGVMLVDPADHLAAALAGRHAGLVPTDPATSPHRVYLTTGDPAAMVAGARAAWGVVVSPRRCDVPARSRGGGGAGSG